MTIFFGPVSGFLCGFTDVFGMAPLLKPGNQTFWIEHSWKEVCLKAAQKSYTDCILDVVDSQLYKNCFMFAHVHYM